MKILALSASPHAHGNSVHLVDELLAGAQELGAETERLDLNHLKIRGCQGDFACKKTGRCGIPDDMQAIYAKIDEADAVVFASPVFMLTVSATLKATIERLFPYLNMDLTSRIVPAKRSAFIVTQTQAEEEAFLPHLQAIPKALGLMGFGETQMLVGSGLEGPGSASQRPDLQFRAREIGRKLAQA